MQTHTGTHLRYPSADLAKNLAAALEAQRKLQKMILNRYQIIRRCGTGGFGTVFACWDTRLQRRVAIKCLPLSQDASIPQTSLYPRTVPAQDHTQTSLRPAPDPTKAIAVTMGEALGEARAASRLSHPNIVSVHDFEVEDGVAFLVMEYVDGITLAELLSRVEGGRLTHDEVASLVQGLGEALVLAHDNDILHLDIKPTNIMFDHEGTMKLCDFGIATLASAAGYADARGGTIGYMPPEQLEGGMVDERTDIFAMAVVTWQALVGSNPFAADSAATSDALIRRGAKSRPSKSDPTLSTIVDATLLSCLSADPQGRPADVRTVTDDLVFGLGDPAEGKKSLAALLSQTYRENTEGKQWDEQRLPLYYRCPWLWPALQRIASAAASGFLTWKLWPYAPFSTDVKVLAITCVVALASILWTPLASLIVGGLTLACLLKEQLNVQSIIAAVAVASFLLPWWIATLHNRGASLALLAAPALGAPAAAASIAADALSPGSACVTAGFSWMLTQLLCAAKDGGFAGSSLVEHFIDLMSWTTLLRFAGIVVGATIGAAITHRATQRSRAIIGQVLCCSIVCTCQFLAYRVENSGIWPVPTLDTVGFALVLGMLVSLAADLRGP